MTGVTSSQKSRKPVTKKICFPIVTVSDSSQTVGHNTPLDRSLIFPLTYTLAWVDSGLGFGVETTYVNGANSHSSGGWNSGSRFTDVKKMTVLKQYLSEAGNSPARWRRTGNSTLSLTSVVNVSGHRAGPLQNQKFLTAGGEFLSYDARR